MSKLQEAKDLLAATEGHTPGPWSILEQPMGEIFDVARCLGEHVAKWVAMEVRGEDAHIIAQAPALRELLAAMVAEVERLEVLVDKLKTRPPLEQCYDCGGENLSHYEDGRTVCQQCGWVPQ